MLTATRGRKSTLSKIVGSPTAANVRGLAYAVPAALTLAMVSAAPVSAQPVIYDVTRIIGHTKNECIGQRAGNCITVSSPRKWVVVDSSAIIRVSCPSTYPHVVGWDARHHEHISLTALPAKPPASTCSPGDDDCLADTAPQRLSVAARNNANARGTVQILVGCSKRPYAGTPIMTSRQAVPSKHPGVTR
jgi:hypothetical protein